MEAYGARRPAVISPLRKPSLHALSRGVSWVAGLFARSTSFEAYRGGFDLDRDYELWLDALFPSEQHRW